MLIKNWGSKSFNAGINDDLFSDKSYKNLQSWCIALIGRMDGYNTYCNITVASCTNSGAHDLNFGLGLLNWVEQICLQ